ncbi:hypothetical protein ACFWPU_29700 [Streptomyces sp. NPDC058471]
MKPIGVTDDDGQIHDAEIIEPDDEDSAAKVSDAERDECAGWIEAEADLFSVPAAVVHRRLMDFVNHDAQTIQRLREGYRHGVPAQLTTAHGKAAR